MQTEQSYSQPKQTDESKLCAFAAIFPQLFERRERLFKGRGRSYSYAVTRKTGFI